MAHRETQTGRDADDGLFSTRDRNELGDPRSLRPVPVLVFDDLPRQLDPAKDDTELDVGTRTKWPRAMERRVRE
jgi:hypothetical protein